MKKERHQQIQRTSKQISAKNRIFKKHITKQSGKPLQTRFRTRFFVGNYYTVCSVILCTANGDKSRCFVLNYLII
jgi:hypothetical protein